MGEIWGIFPFNSEIKELIRKKKHYRSFLAKVDSSTLYGYPDLITTCLNETILKFSFQVSILHPMMVPRVGMMRPQDQPWTRPLSSVSSFGSAAFCTRQLDPAQTLKPPGKISSHHNSPFFQFNQSPFFHITVVGYIHRWVVSRN